MEEIRNEYIRGTAAHVGYFGDKLRGKKDIDYIGRRMLMLELAGRKLLHV